MRELCATVKFGMNETVREELTGGRRKGGVVKKEIGSKLTSSSLSGPARKTLGNY